MGAELAAHDPGKSDEVLERRGRHALEKVIDRHGPAHATEELHSGGWRAKSGGVCTSARTVCRRAEPGVVELEPEQPTNQPSSTILNGFPIAFVLARAVNAQTGHAVTSPC